MCVGYWKLYDQQWKAGSVLKVEMAKFLVLRLGVRRWGPLGSQALIKTEISTLVTTTESGCIQMAIIASICRVVRCPPAIANLNGLD